MTLFSLLRAVRREQGWTQTDLARYIGCSRGQVANAEGGRGASIDMLVSYADALGYDVTVKERRP